MPASQTFTPQALDTAGLNRHHIFALAALPAPWAAEAAEFRQLILLGHAGRRLWTALQAAGLKSDNPIDDFTVRTIADWFADCYPDNHYRLLYPGTQAIGLQQLGKLAGWHHASPFMVGIDAEWGSWFAYRAVILADTDFPPSPVESRASPCLSCQGKDCIAHCPAGAATSDGFILARCIAYRQAANSSCQTTCLARLACPVGREHCYEPEQMAHSYGISLRMLQSLP